MLGQSEEDPAVLGGTLDKGAGHGARDIGPAIEMDRRQGVSCSKP